MRKSMRRFCGGGKGTHAMTEQSCFSFDISRLDAYLREYGAAGYPVVSHSEAYRKAYAPAYRVVVEALTP